jgi:hypothetical protein
MAGICPEVKGLGQFSGQISHYLPENCLFLRLRFLARPTLDLTKRYSSKPKASERRGCSKMQIVRPKKLSFRPECVGERKRTDARSGEPALSD